MDPARIAEEENPGNPVEAIVKSDGLPRASDGSVLSSELTAPQSLSDEHRYIAFLAAVGIGKKEIALKTDRSVKALSHLLRTQIIRDEIAARRKELYSRDADLALKTMIPDSLGVIGKTLRSTKTRPMDRVDIAFRVIERVHGKATQKVDVSGSLFKDMFALLDQRERDRKTIEVHGRNLTESSELPAADTGQIEDAEVRASESQAGVGTDSPTERSGSPVSSPDASIKDPIDSYLDTHFPVTEKPRQA